MHEGQLTNHSACEACTEVRMQASSTLGIYDEGEMKSLKEQHFNTLVDISWLQLGIGVLSSHSV